MSPPLLLRLIARPGVSRVMARIADARPPKAFLRAAIRAYARFYGVNLAEAAESIESFSTFNDFFTRALRPDARPIDQREGIIVSPADSRLQTIGAISADLRLEQIKGSTYSVAGLLGSDEEARRFARGSYATLYLSPAMYHRVHSPADGRILHWRHIPGQLYPVNSLAIGRVEGLFARNERVVVRMESQRNQQIAVVLVGAANVGRISLAFDPLRTNSGTIGGLRQANPPIAVRRGDELGRFNLGSTVVLLISESEAQVPNLAEGDLVKMGQALWQTT